MAKNIFKLGSKYYVATGSGLLVGLFYYLKSEEWPQLQASAIHVPQPLGKWDYNWDRRDVNSLVKPCRNENDPIEQNKVNEKKAKLVPTATRHIFMIRHGQYEDWQNKEEDQKLTLLGNSQAEFVGQRLKDLKFPYSKLIRSTMTRAEETSDIILKYLPDLPTESSDLLREGSPIPVEPPGGFWRQEHKYYRDGPRIEAAFRKYFHRAEASQKTDSYEIIVCHANVIRYFVCRLLQVPPEAWLRFSLYHCSITWTAIAPNGMCRVYAIGDCGFIPQDKMSRV